jgi:hypothetical protein
VSRLDEGGPLFLDGIFHSFAVATAVHTLTRD